MLKLSGGPTAWTAFKGFVARQRYLRGVQCAEKLIEQADQILRGEGTPDRSWQDALELYQAAGKAGSGTAYQRIGDLHRDGEFTEVNLEEALLNYCKSVDLEYIPALSDIAFTYSLLKDYGNAIYNWEKYFKYLDETKITNTHVASKAIFYLLLRIRNEDEFKIYECFYKNLDDIFVQIDGDIEEVVKSISRKLHYLKNLQENEAIKKIYHQIAEEVNDLNDLKKCKLVFLNALARHQ